MRRGRKKIKLTQKQEAWFIKHFRHTENADIAERMGISKSTVIRMAREYGLTKSPQFIRKCREKAQTAAQESHLRNGTYPPKGFRIPRCEEVRYKPGHKESVATKRKRLATRKQTVREERARVNWGLRQLTNLRLIRQPGYVYDQRKYLRQRGYHIQRGSMVAYYDEHTNRCPEMEARKRGDKHFVAFTFRPIGG